MWLIHPTSLEILKLSPLLVSFMLSNFLLKIETEAGEYDDSEGNETMDLSKITDMRLVPSDPSQFSVPFSHFTLFFDLHNPLEQEEEHNWITRAGQKESLSGRYLRILPFPLVIRMGIMAMLRTEFWFGRAVVNLNSMLIWSEGSRSSSVLFFTWDGQSHEMDQVQGPRGLPLVGNLPFLEADLHKYFTKLAQIYGPLLKLRMGKKLCVVLSSPDLIKEVLRDRDATFANRDAPIAVLAVTYGGLDIAWSPHGPMWRMLRKVLVRQMLSNKSLEACYGLRQQEVQQKMKDLYTKIGTPINIGQEVFLMTSNVILSMLWGGRLHGKVRSSVGAEFQMGWQDC
ncbi:hypothetical protein IFM89_023001 [Coptis chinensis]|uniref:Cytochrome P450 n=1 Tax=Coptis chinensis TaxID=261450 RepID=A0A835IAK6_9MAGN|nr:hypothetical protein IFM89_023001 [Coptis chinensis]